MAYCMKLHEDISLFSDIIRRAAEHPMEGGLGIRAQFIEKDYWITNALRNLAESSFSDIAVFKGGTSLSKAHGIGYRFSEDIDIAIMTHGNISDSGLNSTIRSVEKSMAQDMVEIEHPQTSKGSRYRKSFYQYPQQFSSIPNSVISGHLLLEINSFANPFPYGKMLIRSFVADYLLKVMRRDLIEELSLKPFEINVLDKRTTMIEKLISIMRFSLADNPVGELNARIRHFYDLHFLYEDNDCKEFLESSNFKNTFIELLGHDRVMFDNPKGWNRKSIDVSPLITDFHGFWNKLKRRYETELPPLAYSLTVPSSDKIEKSISEIIKFLI